MVAVPQRLLGCSSGCSTTAVVAGVCAGPSLLELEVPEQAVANSARMVRPAAICRARRRWSGVALRHEPWVVLSTVT